MVRALAETPNAIRRWDTRKRASMDASRGTIAALERLMT